LIDQATILAHGLTQNEYQRVLSILGREPNLTELGIFSVMWSEHCSYKSSRIHLRKLPSEGKRVIQGPGENAGAVDIGDGLAAVFKIESHNHPSFIEPYQGAATGVGGIIRDIFTMGARPIALLDSLRFGSLSEPKNRHLVEGVVAGIAGYGNSIGIPTVGGEIAFDETYNGNPLVNVFCLGIAKADALIKGSAEGLGNTVYYVGAKTGRDGIHGATMASAEFDDSSDKKRPNVQVGDPFMEKLLLEACLEAIQTDALIGIQDMGAAGLTCSTCEMGARGGVGIEIDVADVPKRETGMSPYEVMLSESQERMLFIVRKGNESKVEKIFKKWGLHAIRIGRVTGDGLLRVKDNGEVIAEIPNKALVDDGPLYNRPIEQPSDLADRQTLDFAILKDVPKHDIAFNQLLSSPQIASKRWVYRQYDHMVRTNTLVLAGMGAGVVRIKGTDRALAFSVDGNGRYCYLDPYDGARLAVAESARNVACAGGLPIGVTNCLNFGNPERPDIMWQFSRAVDGISDACRKLDLPITGGNVSLYNETDGEAIHPTPVIGVVGVIENSKRVLSRVFKNQGSVIVLLGQSDTDPSGTDLGGSEYLKVIYGLVRGRPPELDLVLERSLQRLLVEVISDGLLESAHDCSDGGLAVTLAECCFESGQIGAEVTMSAETIDGQSDLCIAATLFGETASRVIVSVKESKVDEVITKAAAAGVPSSVIGRTGGSAIRVSVDGSNVIDIALAEAEQFWNEGFSRHFNSLAA
jgi:phosphoribosylformylglycinamidine synthase II